MVVLVCVLTWGGWTWPAEWTGFTAPTGKGVYCLFEASSGCMAATCSENINNSRTVNSSWDRSPGSLRRGAWGWGLPTLWESWSQCTSHFIKGRDASSRLTHTGRCAVVVAWCFARWVCIELLIKSGTSGASVAFAVCAKGLEKPQWGHVGFRERALAVSLKNTLHRWIRMNMSLNVSGIICCCRYAL